MKDVPLEKTNPDKAVRKQSIEETSKITSSASTNIGQVPTSWNETNRDYPLDKCVQDLFEEQVGKTPDAVAVIYLTEQLTYRQLNERANQLAHYLRKQGVKPDTLVGLCIERCTEMIVAIMAILKAGGAYVPLDPGDPKERLALMIDEIHANVILTQYKCADRLPSRSEQIFCIDSEWSIVEALPKTNLKNIARPHNLAYVMFTSGSTGAPKGVMVDHVALVNHLLWLQETFVPTRSDRLLQQTRFTFDVSVYELLLPLIAGSTLVFARPGGHKDPGYLNELIIREGITSAHFVPSMLAVFLEHPRTGDITHLKRVICSGEALPHNLRERFFKCLPHVELHNLYGPTEAAIHVSWWDCRNQADRPIVPIGRPIANTQLHILDDNLKPVPVGTVGELYIGGVQLARGYLNRPDLTRELFISNPLDPGGQTKLYKTGDLCRYLKDGNIEFLGRVDHQVKLRGIRIELGEIESALGKHPAVRQVVVLAREDQPGDMRLVAYMVCPQQTTPEPEDLRNYLGEILPEYMIPSAFVFLDSMPLTANGKIDRKALPPPQQDLRTMEAGYTPPGTPTQKAMTDIFADVLGLEKVGIHDNFFKLGGHSLTATKAIYRIQNRLNVEVPIPALFENPTIAELSQFIEENSRGHNAHPSADPIPRITRRGPLATSYAQKRMWFLYQFEHESPLYNVSFMLYLKGALHIQAIEESLNDIIQRHDSLRTTFEMREGEPVQIIHPHTYQQVPVEKVSELSSEGPRGLVDHPVIKEEVKRLFDLKQGPLIRFRILRLSQDTHALLFTVHHIVFDGWSVDVLLHELAAAYGARIQGRSPEFPSLPIQYADYADWQQKWLESETRQKQLSYWLEQLKQPLPILELPTDYHHPAVQTYKGHSDSLTLSTKLTNDLRQLSYREGKTLFMTLFAAFNVLLHRYTGQKDLIVGSPIANRTREEIEPLIGFFVNTLALRTNLSGNPTFCELLDRVQRVCLDGYVNQDLPFEQLVVHLQPERSASRTPVFQVMFVIQNAHDRQITLPGLEVVCEEISTDTSKLDLTLFMEEFGDHLIATAEYNTDLFKTDTIRRLLGYYQRLLDEIASNPDSRLRDLVLLADSEPKPIVEDLKQPARDYPQDKCVHQLFDEQAVKTPDAVAVVHQTEQLTYRQLNERANQLAHYLRRQGVKADTLVGVYLDRCAELIVALLGILKAGGAYVPLDTAYPKGRLRQMIEDTDLKIILTQDSLISHLEAHNAQSICLNANWGTISREAVDSPPSLTEPDHLAYVMFTSGSTGRPKGVAIPHKGIVRLVFGVDYVDLEGYQTFLQLAPISFDASTFEIWAALLHGHCCVLFPDRIPDLHKLSEILKTYHVSCLWLTSSLFNFIIDKKPQALRGVSQLLTGGEALSVEHVRRALALLPNTQLINGYGPTESTTFTCCYPIPRRLDERLHSIPIGRPIGRTQVYILDQQMNPVPAGTPGELYIGGDGLARGYVNRPELTGERFVNDPFDPSGRTKLYKTGDLCRYLADGNIEFLGRLDHQVKIRGFRIELGEIESTLGRHPAVRQVVVLAREDQPGDKRLVAYVVRAQGASAGPDDMRDYLKDTLPEYMIPSAWVFLDSMPLTPNDKIDRNALPAPPRGLGPEQATETRQAGYVAPETPVQRALAEIFAEVLGVEKVGIHDDFFKLGGHSLLAVRLLDRILGRFGQSLPLATLFQATTVKQICELLATGQADTPGSSIVLIRPGGSGDPIFILPGVGGHSMAFSTLANRLDPDRPIYGLELQGLDGKAKPHKTIEDMAAYFVGLIRGVQKQGPYHLAGYSLGGRIAFDMAVQLAEQGQQVGMLAIIAATAPGYPRSSKYRLVRYALRSMDFLRLPFKERLNYLSFKLRKDLRRRIRRWRQERAFDSAATVADRGLRANIKKVEASAYEAWYTYNRKGRYSGNVLLLQETNLDSPLDCGKIHALAGWEHYVTGTIECHEISSGHLDILKEPYVSLLAERITNYIRQIQDASRSSSSIRCIAEKQMQNKAEASDTPRRGLAAWPSAPEVFPIPRDEVHVFLVDLDGSGSLPRHKSMLSSDEIDRANRYAQARDRDRFIARRGFLRELLAGYTGIKAAHIELQYSENGRPSLSETQNPLDMTFSLSAREGLALYAFTCNRPVGIDLEYIHPATDLLEIARRQLSLREYEDISKLPESLQQEAFYRCWVCKEAYIKARGIIPLKEFDVSAEPGRAPTLLADRSDPSGVRQWSFSLLDLGVNWRAVVVAQSRNLPLKCWKIDKV